MSFRQRTQRARKTPPSRIDRAELAILRDTEPGDGCNRFVIHAFTLARARAAWARRREDILKDWPEGTRPLAFYLFDLPGNIEPSFPLPSRPTAWALYPETIPSAATQKAFLKKLKTLNE